MEGHFLNNKNGIQENESKPGLIAGLLVVGFGLLVFLGVAAKSFLSTDDNPQTKEGINGHNRRSTSIRFDKSEVIDSSKNNDSLPLEAITGCFKEASRRKFEETTTTDKILANMERYTDGKSKSLYAIFGDPGTGKSVLARYHLVPAIAACIEYKTGQKSTFLELPGDMFHTVELVGSDLQVMRAFFKYLEELCKCGKYTIVFANELSSLFLKRKATPYSGSKTDVESFMAMMDAILEKYPGYVSFVCTFNPPSTNDKNSSDYGIDPAVARRWNMIYVECERSKRAILQMIKNSLFIFIQKNLKTEDDIFKKEKETITNYILSDFLNICEESVTEYFREKHYTITKNLPVTASVLSDAIQTHLKCLMLFYFTAHTFWVEYTQCESNELKKKVLKLLEDLQLKNENSIAEEETTYDIFKSRQKMDKLNKILEDYEKDQNSAFKSLLRYLLLKKAEQSPEAMATCATVIKHILEKTSSSSGKILDFSTYINSITTEESTKEKILAAIGNCMNDPITNEEVLDEDTEEEERLVPKNGSTTALYKFTEVASETN